MLKRLLLFSVLCSSMAALFAASLYVWTDRNGVRHYEQGGAAPDAAVQKEYREDHDHEIAWIPDGDTIHLKNGWKIRLIGINTPEIGKRRQPGQPGAEEARRYLKKLLDHHRIRLEYDQERFDRYRRRLAYVIRDDGLDVNAAILKAGWGHVNIVPPNVGRIESYLLLERQARKAGIGIWAYPENRQKVVGRDKISRGFHRVRGRVVSVTENRKWIGLNMSSSFQVRLSRRKVQSYFQSSFSPSQWLDHWLELRGWVGRKGEKRILWLDHPLQVEVWPSERP
ncbi:MAG: hypothetical protein D6698_01710 [Gammaproteobacteria bacterium]|nr:MAG: hypothetical protein D6698_01710 [Gammaproteobacteria bacterium]